MSSSSNSVVPSLNEVRDALNEVALNAISSISHSDDSGYVKLDSTSQLIFKKQFPDDPYSSDFDLYGDDALRRDVVLDYTVTGGEPDLTPITYQIDILKRFWSDQMPACFTLNDDGSLTIHNVEWTSTMKEIVVNQFSRILQDFVNVQAESCVRTRQARDDIFARLSALVYQCMTDSHVGIYCTLFGATNFLTASKIAKFMAISFVGNMLRFHSRVRCRLLELGYKYVYVCINDYLNPGGIKFSEFAPNEQIEVEYADSTRKVTVHVDPKSDTAYIVIPYNWEEIFTLSVDDCGHHDSSGDDVWARNLLGPFIAILSIFRTFDIMYEKGMMVAFPKRTLRQLFSRIEHMAYME